MITCHDAGLKARLQTVMNGIPMKEELELLRRRGPECKEAAEDLVGVSYADISSLSHPLLFTLHVLLLPTHTSGVTDLYTL